MIANGPNTHTLSYMKVWHEVELNKHNFLYEDLHHAISKTSNHNPIAEESILILVSWATPPIVSGKGSGECMYNELVCDKILSCPIRFSYSGI